MPDFCAYCGEEIPVSTVKSRHRTADDTRPMTCNLECEKGRRKRDGIYKAMSEAGKEQRSQAVTVSNREQPRRKKASSHA